LIVTETLTCLSVEANSRVDSKLRKVAIIDLHLETGQMGNEPVPDLALM